jgi:colanic acid biosynthesis glycosyl transferase WcaI
MTNRNKSVLVFSPFFHPESISTGRYNTHLVEELQRTGCDVTVVCSHPFYPNWSVKPAEEDFHPGIRTIRGGANVSYPDSQVLKRLMLELWYARFVRKTVSALSGQRFDLVIDIYPPNLFALTSNRRFSFGAPVVGIIHDLQGVMSQAKSSFLRRLVGAAIRPLEKAVLARCDHLVVLSRAMQRCVIDDYGVDNVSCEVSYPFETLGDAPSITPEPLRASGKTLVYSGALGEKQAPVQLLELMHAFALQRPDFGVFVFSGGPLFEQLRQLYSKMGSRIEFHGLVPDTELEGLLRKSTIQLIPQLHGVTHGAFPSKLPNLIAAGTAFLAITDAGSEVDDIAQRYSRGASVNSWSAEATSKALHDLALALEDGSGQPDSGAHNSDKELRDLFSSRSLCDRLHSWMPPDPDASPRIVPSNQ